MTVCSISSKDTVSVIPRVVASMKKKELWTLATRAEQRSGAVIQHPQTTEVVYKKKKKIQFNLYARWDTEVGPLKHLLTTQSAPEGPVLMRCLRAS
jgi:hypothetical protein